MDQQLYCGAAREKITPPENLWENLRGLMDSSFGGVADDIFIRVIALKNGAEKLLLISGDLDKLPNPEENMHALNAATGVSPDHMLYFSIHTHSAPVTGYRPYEGPNFMDRKPESVQKATKQYEEFLLKKLLLAADRALGSMRPATVGYAYGTSDVNVNRIEFYEVEDGKGNVRTVLGTGNNFRRAADRKLFVMRFADLKGEPIAFFVNYPVHNTVMILNSCGRDGKVGISADLGGNVSKCMENRYKGCVAMWSSGAAGDLNPVMSNQVYREEPETGAPKEYYEKDPAVPLSMLKTLVSHHFADVKKTIRGIGAEFFDAKLSAAGMWAEVPGSDERGEPVPYRVYVQKLAIGPIVLIGFSGELYSQLGKEIKEACGRENLILINHNASLIYNTGYIYSDEAFELAKKYGGEIVGMNHTWLKEGCIAKELIRCVKTLLKRDESLIMKNHCISKDAEDHIKNKIFDIGYASLSRSQILDIWYPNEKSEKPYPVIVHFHGGGFSRGGHREDSVEPMLRGTDRGYAVVSVEYRKSKEARFPAMLYDAKAAVRFIRAHAKKYHLDEERIALWGPSAGGWIVSMLALTTGNPAFEDLTMGNAEYESRAAAVVDWCGPCGGFLEMDADLKKRGIPGVEEHNSPDSSESQFMGAPLQSIPELVRLADPRLYVNKDMPPFIIVHGTEDAVVPVDQSIRFARAIREIAGDDKVELHVEDGVPHHGRIWWHEDYAADICFDFLDRVLKNK